jgi:hypothetical protein
MKTLTRRLGAAAVAAALALISLAAAAAPSASAATYPALTRVHDPGHVTGTMHGRCYLRAHGQLPDPRCTPGSYDPQMTRARLCAPGYHTATYRPLSSQTTRAKYQVVEPAYGQHSVYGELDHLVPLELGGSNDMTNFWVEAGKIPNPKDAVENRLHREMCAGQISLRTAQLDIAHNWRTAPGATAAATTIIPAATAGNSTSDNWAGYMTAVPKSRGPIQTVLANMVAPRLNCGASSGPGPFETAFWIGIGGTNSESNSLPQVGFVGYCRSKQDRNPEYKAFWEMNPNAGGFINTQFRNSAGKFVTIPIHPGETVGMEINSPTSTLPFGRKGDYRLSVNPGGLSLYGYGGQELAPYNIWSPPVAGTAEGTTAEVIVERPYIGKGAYRNFIDTGTVTFSDSIVVFGNKRGVLPIDQNTFTATRKVWVAPPVPYWHTVILEKPAGIVPDANGNPMPSERVAYTGKYYW